MSKLNKPLLNGSGSGDGSGSGYCYGDGSGYGYGYGYGSGYGSGYGDGDGYGLKSLNGLKIYIVDGIETIITSVKKNVAKGFTVNKDLTLKPCLIAKGENKFSHGSTLKEAVNSLQEKLLQDLPVPQRIAKFLENFKPKKKYKAKKYYKWHFFLTGSCEFGRRDFVDQNGIDLENDKFTVQEFIDKVRNAFGSDVIKQLESEYITKGGEG